MTLPSQSRPIGDVNPNFMKRCSNLRPSIRRRKWTMPKQIFEMFPLAKNDSHYSKRDVKARKSLLVSSVATRITRVVDYVWSRAGHIALSVVKKSSSRKDCFPVMIYS